MHSPAAGSTPSIPTHTSPCTASAALSASSPTPTRLPLSVLRTQVRNGQGPKGALGLGAVDSQAPGTLGQGLFPGGRVLGPSVRRHPRQAVLTAGPASSGIVEVEEGELNGQELSIASHSIARISFAKEPHVQQVRSHTTHTPWTQVPG